MKHYLHLPRVAAFLASIAVFAADGWAQREIIVRFSDPSRPGTLTASVSQGDISVTGHDGDDVVVSTTNRLPGVEPEEIPARAQGLRRIGSGDVNITQRNNVITIDDRAWTRGTHDLAIRVPRETSLDLNATSGDVRVTATEGEVEVQTMSGSVYLTDVSGPAVVHARNGEVVAAFTSVTGEMPVSISTMNGEIDLSLPSSADATLAINTSRGDIYSDFDVSLEVRSSPEETGNRIWTPTGRTTGRLLGLVVTAPFFHGETSQTLFGDINDGGAQISLNTFQGNIYIRRGD